MTWVTRDVRVLEATFFVIRDAQNISVQYIGSPAIHNHSPLDVEKVRYSGDKSCLNIQYAFLAFSGNDCDSHVT